MERSKIGKKINKNTSEDDIMKNVIILGNNIFTYPSNHPSQSKLSAKSNYTNMENQKIARFKVVGIPTPAGINYGQGLVFERYLDLSELKELKKKFENLEQGKIIRYPLDLTFHSDLIGVNIENISVDNDEIWSFEVEIPPKSDKNKDIDKFCKLMEENKFAFGADDGPKYEIVEK